MKLTPARYFLTTLLLAATGAWLGYRRATQPAPPAAPPQAAILSQPAAPVAATPATTAGVEDLVLRYLTACDEDPALAGALRQQLLAVSPPLLQQAWEELAARHPNLDADDIRSVLDTLRHILCERDPMGSIPWLVQKCPRGQLTNQLWTMLESWSARDPSAAWAGIMAETIPPSVRDGLTNAFTTIGHDYAQRDPAAAFAALLALPADHWLPDYAAEILCREAATPGRRMAMLEQLVRQPPGRMRTAGLKGILELQAQNEPLSQVGEWIQSQPLPEEEKDTLLASAAAAAVPDDPRAALDWLLAHARPETAAESLNALTRQWADASPNDCGEWLRTLPPGPTTDAALMAFVDEVRDHDPESAFQWTRRFNNPEQRRTFAVSTWEKWRTLAPISAARFASQLDPQERAWLKLGGAR